MEIKTPKPSKAELLKELESIRESLLSDSLALEEPLSETPPSVVKPAAKPAPAAHDEKPQALMKKSYLDFDESEYDYELKIPAHATTSDNTDTAASDAYEASEQTVDQVTEQDSEHTTKEESHEDETDDIAELAQMLDSEDDDTQPESAIELAIELADDEYSDIETLSESPLPSQTPTMEIPAINERMVAQAENANTESKAPPHVLPGQQSLFDDAISEADIPQQTNSPQSLSTQAVPTNTIATAVASNTAKTSSHVKVTKGKPMPDTPKKPVENPFLPQHIKAKLERERSLYEQEINATVQAQAAKAQSAASLPTRAAFTAKISDSRSLDKEALSQKHERLIDELVAEYLPRIEARLRDKLREKFLDSND